MKQLSKKLGVILATTMVFFITDCAKKPGPKYYYKQAENLEADGKHQEAIANYQIIIDSYPSHKLAKQAQEKILQCKKAMEETETRRKAEKEVQEAIEWGKQNKSNFKAINDPYSIFYPCFGVERVVIQTPYWRVAFKAAHKAREYESVSQEKEFSLFYKNELITLGCSLFGPEIDFAEDIKAVLNFNGSIIKPQESHTEKIASSRKKIFNVDRYGRAYTVWGDAYYWAYNIYLFDHFDKFKNKKGELILIPLPSRWVAAAQFGPLAKQEIKIPIDFSKYR